MTVTTCRTPPLDLTWGCMLDIHIFGKVCCILLVSRTPRTRTQPAPKPRGFPLFRCKKLGLNDLDKQ